MTFIEELQWRGLLHDKMPGVEEHMAAGMVTGYVGFDPTAASLGIGNLVPIMLLVHLQRHGHKPIAVVGGATGMVGDPSGKSSERNLLSIDQLRHNEAGVKMQLEKFLDFSDTQNSAVLVNNFDWMKDYSFLDFLREVGKHLTINYMLAKDSVKNRLDTGMSFTEFSYQLLQGYDFYHLYKNHGCTLQMGGSDQWGNMTSGTELIRRMAAGETWCITNPLVTKSDGSKFGKSESGNVWLDRSMTSPYKFYQFWLNVTDEEAARFIRVYTLLGKEEIEALEAEHILTPHLRILQKRLSQEVTTLVHSSADYQQAIEASNLLFGNGTTEQLKTMNEELLLAVMDGVPQVEVAQDLLLNVDIVDVLSANTGNSIFPSKGEARKMLQGGGVSINKQKIDEAHKLQASDLLNGKYILAQKGKKNYYLIKAN
ncbi:MAG: tyrosine--tRNA ligase [Flavobacteriaceae bacterium]|nr:tyrosine--tRNA ligase [Flavobacteriaceae bacterium]